MRPVKTWIASAVFFCSVSTSPLRKRACGSRFGCRRQLGSRRPCPSAAGEAGPTRRASASLRGHRSGAASRRRGFRTCKARREAVERPCFPHRGGGGASCHNLLNSLGSTFFNPAGASHWLTSTLASMAAPAPSGVRRALGRLGFWLFPASVLNVRRNRASCNVDDAALRASHSHADPTIYNTLARQRRFVTHVAGRCGLYVCGHECLLALPTIRMPAP